MLLKQFVASSGGSTADIFDKIVDLIKELTDDEVPEDWRNSLHIQVFYSWVQELLHEKCVCSRE